jgi:hypothetical protein
MDSELAGDLIFLKDAYLASGERIRGSQQEKKGEDYYQLIRVK